MRWWTHSVWNFKESKTLTTISRIVHQQRIDYLYPFTHCMTWTQPSARGPVCISHTSHTNSEFVQSLYFTYFTYQQWICGHFVSLLCLEINATKTALPHCWGVHLELIGPLKPRHENLSKLVLINKWLDLTTVATDNSNELWGKTT